MVTREGGGFTSSRLWRGAGEGGGGLVTGGGDLSLPGM